MTAELCLQPTYPHHDRLGINFSPVQVPGHHHCMGHGLMPPSLTLSMKKSDADPRKDATVGFIMGPPPPSRAASLLASNVDLQAMEHVCIRDTGPILATQHLTPTRGPSQSILQNQ